MTSNKSSVKSAKPEGKFKSPFFHTFFSSLKGASLSPAILNALMFLLVMTLPSAIKLFGENQYFDETKKELVTQKIADSYRYIFITNSDILSVLLLIGVVILSIFAAIFSFKFITSKKTVNVFYSIGISRDKLFFAKYLSGALLMLISIAVPIVITLVFNIIRCGITSYLLSAALYYFLSFSAVSLATFSIASAVFATVGTFFEASIFTGLTVAFPTIFLYCLQTLMTKFLYGSPYGSTFSYANSGYVYSDTSEKLYMKYANLSPILFDSKQLGQWGALAKDSMTNPQFTLSGPTALPFRPSLLYPIIWILISIAIMFCGMYFFQKRKAEICGFIGTNKVFNALAGFTVGFFALCVIASQSFLTSVARIAIGCAVFAVLYIILELVLLRNFKAFLRGLYKLPCEIALGIAILVAFNTGLFGYSSKIPAAADIQSVAVSTAGYCAEYGLLPYDQYNYLSRSDDYCYTNATALVDGFTSDSDKEAIIDIHKSVLSSKDELSGAVNLFNVSAENYDTAQKYYAFPLQFVYTLKDGTKLMRSYTAILPSTYEKLLSLEKSDLFAQKLTEIFAGEFKELKDEEVNALQTADKVKYMISKAIHSNKSLITLETKNSDATINLNLTDAERKELVACVYKDLSARTLEQKYYPASTVLTMKFSNDTFDFTPYNTPAEDFTIPDDVIPDDVIPDDVIPDEVVPDGENPDGTEPGFDAEALMEMLASLDEEQLTVLTAVISSLDAEGTVSLLSLLLNYSPEELAGVFSILSEYSPEELAAIIEQSKQIPTTEPTTEGTTAEEPTTEEPTTEPSSTESTTASVKRNRIMKLSIEAVTEASIAPSADEDGAILGTVVNRGVKFSGNGYHTDLFSPSGYNQYVTVEITADMENTIKFLKEKGLYTSAYYDIPFAKAEIIPVKSYYAANGRYYGDSYFSINYTPTAFLSGGTIIISNPTEKDQFGNVTYISSLFTDYNSLGVTDSKEIAALYDLSVFTYLNVNVNGYFVRFVTADKKIMVSRYIPEDKMPEAYKNQLTDFSLEYSGY